MKHLLIDCTFLINELKRKRPPHGIPRVVLASLHNYLDRFQLVYQVRGRIFILPKSISKKIALLMLSWDFKRYSKVLALVIQGIFLSEKIKKNDSYFLLKIDQNGMKYPSYFSSINKMGIKMLVTIHDIFPIIYPEYSEPNYSIQFEHNIKMSLKNAVGMICVSQFTKETLAHYVKSTGLISPPTIAAALAPGFSPDFPQGKRPINEPYFVMISTIVARKNHLLLLHIWRKLADQLGAKAPKLVIIGKRSSECSSTIEMLDRCEQLRKLVIEVQASDQELTNYLLHATALLFPTFAEGYGLPLMEALNIGVPVIASDLPIFREIALDVPEYLDPIDGKGWLEMIKVYAQEQSLPREAQLSRIKKFKMPTWEEHFNKIDLFLEELV
jgi:glycosyltransferase involved in cell wall biosynthesis